MSTLELEHLKHTSSSNNNLSVHSDGSLTVGMLQGNVGIGTASPTVKLEVAGDIKESVSGANAQISAVTDGASNYATFTATNGSRSYSMQIRPDQSNAFTIRDETGGGNRLLIDTAGYVLKPSQPACFAFKAGSGNGTGDSGAGALNTTGTNNGNHFSTSTGRFTCPVAGMYMVCWTMMNSQSNTGTAVCIFRVNGTGYKYFHVENSHPQGQSDQVVYTANANDYFDISLTHYHYNGGSQFKYPSMSVFLIG